MQSRTEGTVCDSDRFRVCVCIRVRGCGLQVGCSALPLASAAALSSLILCSTFATMSGYVLATHTSVCGVIFTFIYDLRIAVYVVRYFMSVSSLSMSAP